MRVIEGVILHEILARSYLEFINMWCEVTARKVGGLQIPLTHHVDREFAV
jgi:hypothetical protein